MDLSVASTKLETEMIVCEAANAIFRFQIGKRHILGMSNICKGDWLIVFRTCPRPWH